MPWIADLHIHSRFSLATSRDLSFASLHRSALRKGIRLVGTGDCTHPGWMLEIREELEPDGSGFLRLKPALARDAEADIPPSCRGDVRFVLQTEISSIYRRDGRVRRIHNLVFLPSLEAADRLALRLSAIGNLASDGRPILKLDARDLLEIVLETDPAAFLVPAHIWTPWYSLLGSRSGFDTIEECFGDLAYEVFAVETGLSSDPPMNRRVSALDRLTLVSNSDAHSAEKLGREANLFEDEVSYEGMLRALRTREDLRTGRGFAGTIEFFPEGGKYHFDGHRRCDVRLDPEKGRLPGDRCPACGRPLTIGVLSRVLELADRPAGFAQDGAPGSERLVCLADVASEILGVGAGSRKVKVFTDRMLEDLGPELYILREAPLEDLWRAGGELMAEAVRRIRSGDVHLEPGYDGVYGTVRVLADPAVD